MHFITAMIAFQSSTAFAAIPQSTIHLDISETTGAAQKTRLMYLGYGYRSQQQQTLQLSTQGHVNLLNLIQVRGEGFALLGAGTKDPMNVIDAPEAYVGLGSSSFPIGIQVGRKKVTWNQADDLWEMGVWQPRNRWDYIDPLPVGLVGGFLSWRTPLVSTDIFASPGFLPEAGPASALNNGKFNSSSPWFQPPSPYLSFNQQLVPIRYSIDTYDVMQIVKNAGFSGRMRVGLQDQGPFLQVAGAYKPMNQLMLGYDGVLNLGSQEANIRLRPSVAYHRLVGVDGGLQNWNGLSQKFSVLGETVLMPSHADGYTYRQASDALTWMSDTSFELNKDYQTTFRLGFLRRLGGNAPDKGKDARPGESIFEDRYPFTSAARIGASSRLGFLNLEKVSAKTELTYDFLMQSEIYRLQLNYQPAAQWNLVLGADILGSQLPAEVYSQDWIRSFSINDRVYGGVSYVF